MTTDGTSACAFPARLTRDERGSHTTEVALSIGLFALIAGFGFFTFGDALAEFFSVFGGGLSENTISFPDYGTEPLVDPDA